MADYDFVTSAGTILPDTADTLAEVENEYREALGADLVVTPDTPQGVLIAAETEARDQVLRNNAELANQINPNLAGGIFLDAIWALTGGERVKATRSLVTGVVVTGTPGALIPAGSQARVGPGGSLWSMAGATLLDNAGNGTADFLSVDYGPIAAPAGALDTIATAVLGWETVTNPTPAEPGLREESDAAARVRRRQTLALQGVSLPEAILSRLYATDDVRSALFRENITDAPVTIEGVNLAPHSIYVCVEGGTDQAVAQAIKGKKSLGANYNGSVTVNVTDEASGQIYPVKFDRPDDVLIYVQVTVKQGTAVGDVAQLTRAAMVAYANGELEGEPGFTIGNDVSPFELAGAVNREAPGVYVQSVLVSDDNVTFAATPIAILINQQAKLISGNIAVTVAP